MSRYGPGGFHDGPGVLGWLLVVALVALVVLGIVALVRTWGSPGWRSAPPQVSAPPQTGTPAGPSADPAFHELRVRYARGDITWDEYALRAANLGYPVPPGTGSAGSPPRAEPPSAS